MIERQRSAFMRIIERVRQALWAGRLNRASRPGLAPQNFFQQ